MNLIDELLIALMIERIHPLIVKTIVWPDEAATLAFAQGLAGRPAICNTMIEMSGDLGVGKTTFVRYLLTALGVQGRIKSPTYAVVEPYTLPALPGHADAFDIWHFDFYRFEDPREWEEAGFRDIFANAGLKLVEWPEKAGAYLPQPDLRMAIEMGDGQSRQVVLSAYTSQGAELIETK